MEAATKKAMKQEDEEIEGLVGSIMKEDNKDRSNEVLQFIKQTLQRWRGARKIQVDRGEAKAGCGAHGSEDDGRDQPVINQVCSALHEETRSPKLGAGGFFSKARCRWDVATMRGHQRDGNSIAL